MLIRAICTFGPIIGPLHVPKVVTARCCVQVETLWEELMVLTLTCVHVCGTAGAISSFDYE